MGLRKRRTRCLSPLGAIVRGAIAGAAGTAAMDAAQYAQYRRGGGTQQFGAWETSEGLDDWESAPAPAKLAKRVFEGVAQRELKPGKARLDDLQDKEPLSCLRLFFLSARGAGGAFQFYREC